MLTRGQSIGSSLAEKQEVCLKDSSETQAGQHGREPASDTAEVRAVGTMRKERLLRSCLLKSYVEAQLSRCDCRNVVLGQLRFDVCPGDSCTKAGLISYCCYKQKLGLILAHSLSAQPIMVEKPWQQERGVARYMASTVRKQLAT